MKKKTCFKIISVTLLASMMLVGCGGESKESEKEAASSVSDQVVEESAKVLEGTLSAEDDAESVVLTAFDAYGKQNKKGSSLEAKSIYDNGMEDVTKVTVSSDLQAAVMEYLFEVEDGTTKEFFTKENNEYFTYVYVENSMDHISIRYRKQPGGAYTPYQLLEKGMLFRYAKSDGYEEVNYQNLGEDSIEGKDAVKIMVTAKKTYDEGSEEVSFSERIETTLWVDKESHLPIQILNKQMTEGFDDENSEEGGFQNVVETDTKEIFVYGDDCAEVEDVPNDYKTITESQYLNGEY